MCAVSTAIQIKSRGIFGSWLRRWIYTLNCEQAAIEGQAAFWVPTPAHCIICKAAFVPGYEFCPWCGVYQRIEPDGPQTEPHYFVWVDGKPKQMRLNGKSPLHAYLDMVRKPEENT